MSKRASANLRKPAPMKRAAAKTSPRKKPLPAVKPAPAKRKVFGADLKLSNTEIFNLFMAQRARQQITRLHKQAAAARNKYRARKKDRGQLVFIGVKGQPDPQKKGRKGFLIYVTKTGKKRLVRDERNGEVPRKLKDIEVPFKKNNIRAAKDFIQRHRKKLKSGRVAVKGRGELKPGRGGYDFTDSMVSKMARSLKWTIESQASNRNFIFHAKVLVRLPDGKETVFDVQVPIAKADNIAIKIGGMENFIRQKFYAFMARQLAFAGLVTMGSANHVRRLPDNQGVEPEEMTDRNGNAWGGAGLDICKIQAIDWQIEQS